MKRPILPAVLRHSLWLLLVALWAPASGWAQSASPYMAYQGCLTDGTGQLLGGTNSGPNNYQVIFRIWDQSAGGTIGGPDDLFAEQQTVAVNSGYFNVLLGQGSVVGTENHPSLATIFTNSGLYVELTVSNWANGSFYTLTPRLPLLTAPYAFLAQNAVTANVAAYAQTLGAGGTNAPAISLPGNSVSNSVSLAVAGAMTATNLVVGDATTGANQPLVVNGLVGLLGLNVTNAMSAFNLTVTNGVLASSLSAGNVQLAAGLTANNTVSTANLTVSNTVAAAGVQITNTLSTGQASAASLTAGTLVASNLAVAATNVVTAARLNVSAVESVAALMITNVLTATNLNASGAVVIYSTNNSATLAGADVPQRLICGALTNNFSGANSTNAGHLPVNITLGASWFAVAHHTNYYTVTFTTKFSGPPVVIVTAMDPQFPANDDHSYTYLYDFNGPLLTSVSSTGFTVVFVNYDYDGSGLAAYDQDFSFIAIGPP